MTRTIGVKAPRANDNLQDIVFVVEAPNAATAKGKVSSETGMPREILSFVQLRNLD